MKEEGMDKMSQWRIISNTWWLDVARIILGSVLFYKGVMFSKYPEELLLLTEAKHTDLLAIFLIHYIPLVHIAGGIMIAVGLLTRLAIIFQLPVLIGALYYTVNDNSVFELYSDFVFAYIIFSLLVLFLLTGPGPYSLDEEWKNSNG